MMPRRIFPERVLGRRLTTVAFLSAATGPILSRTISYDLAHDLTVAATHACFEHEETQRNLSLKLVGNADDGALSDVWVRSEHLLHRPSREPMPGDVNDIVGAGHDEDIPVLVDKARVARLVVARKLGVVDLQDPCPFLALNSRLTL